MINFLLQHSSCRRRSLSVICRHHSASSCDCILAPLFEQKWADEQTSVTQLWREEFTVMGTSLFSFLPLCFCTSFSVPLFLSSRSAFTMMNFLLRHSFCRRRSLSVVSEHHCAPSRNCILAPLFGAKLSKWANEQTSVIQLWREELTVIWEHHLPLPATVFFRGGHLLVFFVRCLLVPLFKTLVCCPPVFLIILVCNH